MTTHFRRAIVHVGAAVHSAADSHTPVGAIFHAEPMRSTSLRDSLDSSVRIARNCWLPAAQASDLAARCAAVLDSSPADTVIGSITAARLHGLWLPDHREEIHVVTASPGRAGRSMTRTRRPEFVAHRFQLRAHDVTIAHGLPITTIARTWRDLAATMGLADLVAAGDRALQLGASRQDLADAVAAAASARHTRCARKALGWLDARSRSRPESHLRVALRCGRLPEFEVNEAIYRDEGGWLAEPDLSLAEARLALEYQGRDHANERRMRKDITRARDLRAEGWQCLYYGPAEVFGRPWTIAHEVFAAVRERAPHLVRRT